MDVNTCKEKGIIRQAKKDHNLILSLCDMSTIKEDIINNTTFNEININGFFPMAYDSQRELMEALCISNGYKVSNHECLGKLVKSLYPQFDLITFERLRYARNGINYYGTKIDLHQAQELIIKIVEINHVLHQLIRLSDNLK